MIDLLAETDLDWVADIIDVVERNSGQPWRTALEQLDDLERASMLGPGAARATSGPCGAAAASSLASASGPASVRTRFRAVVGAIQRVTGGRTRNGRAARTARGLVLGHPALAPGERQARIDHAALVLGVPARTVETLLWSDLPRERPVELPRGRPHDLEVAALANISLLQRAMTRAQAITVRVRAEDAGPLVRAAAARGLLVSTTAADRDATIVEVAGPLSLCHRTAVYGRALGDLVPLLGGLGRWTLEITVVLPLATFSRRVSSPVLLPAPPARLEATPYPIARLCRALERATHGNQPLAVVPTPAPLRVERHLLWPDLVVDDGPRRTYIELVGFWTRDHLDRKLAAYRLAGCDVLLCVDRARGAGDAGMPAQALPYTRRLPADAILARLRPS